ncbi:DUF4279 domain-containing protein [Caballeronia cordobensis]|uniref:DUF4279 domain-containing protein n=1 Tax=Caballeronia cordobensis TaxID=1353886 RepID=UPI001F185F1E|nr:DUF4279 domain-containing protein [Caballeronia cordobensis]
MLAHASFTISGDAVIPQVWTRYFQHDPDIAVAKGDAINDPTGEGRDLRRRTGVWGISSKGKVQSDLLEPHLRSLIERLRLPRADLREVIEQQGGIVRFFCFWVNESGDRVPDIPDDIRTMMEAMGGTIEIDEYR